MPSKELIGYLDDMKITGKTASSSLEDVFVQMVRKKLAPVLEERAAELEEKRRAEEEAAAAEEAERFKCFPDQKPVCRFQRFFDDNLTQFNPEWIEIQVFEHF